MGAIARPTTARPEESTTMATCKECGSEVEELKTVKVGGKKKKMCEDCADRAAEQGAIAEESEAVVQQMMGFKGRR
jgi:DNA replicative helicase MCM subunit Mcm2 (Cdc46/Mcm family)